MDINQPITKFRGKYAFLSNFAPCIVTYEGRSYPSVEAAFQASKTLDPSDRKQFETMSPEDAKRWGRKVTLRDDWELVKDEIMLSLVSQKFTDSRYREHLIATGCAEIVECNHWGDDYWGKCTSQGKNRLGQILMEVRSKLLENSSS